MTPAAFHPSPGLFRIFSSKRGMAVVVCAAVAAASIPATGQTNEPAPVVGLVHRDNEAKLEAAVAAGRAAESQKSAEQSHGELSRALLTACRAGNAALAAQALAAGADPNVGPSPLAIAAESNNLELTRMVLHYGGDASRAPAALRAALRHKNQEMASLLLNAGADPNLPDASGVTALGTTLSAGEIDLARLMFRHGGYPDEFLEPALQQGDLQLLGSLFQYGLSPDRTDASGNPLLVRAAMQGKTEIVKFLLEKGAHPGKPGREGQTALHYAVVAKNDPVLRALLEGGADPNQPFFSPVRDDFLSRVDDERFKKWLRRDTGLTLLMLAAARGDTGMIKLLLENGARRGLQSKGWKRYPVVFACDAEHIPAAKILLGRDPAAREPELRVTIVLSQQRATLYRNDEPVRTCRVSTGRRGYPTPTGKYVITDKQRDWVSTIYKVSMPYFMRLNCREIGMHAGNCPGYPASHGCIRMPWPDAKVLYSTLKIGDAVTIEE